MAPACPRGHALAGVGVRARRGDRHRPRLSGEQSETALSVGCPLDLAAFPIGGCTRTVFGKAEIILWRREATSFHLEVWRSFAPYVTALLEAGVQDLG